MLGTSKSISGFDPRSVPGCQLWLDGADTSSMTLSGSNVTQWNDKSGNGYNFVTQGSFAAPVISNNAISTNSAVSFTGNSTQNDTANQILTNSSFPLNPSGAGYSIFAVTRQNESHPSYSGYNYILSAYGGGTGAGLLYGTTNSNLLITANGTSGAFYGFNDLTANVPNTLMTSMNQTCMIVSGNVLTPYLNGVAMSTKTGTSDAVTGISIGNAYAPGQTFTGQTWGGLICEVFIYNSALTTSQRQQVEGYLAHKWGLVPPSSTVPLTIPGCQLWLDAADTSSLTLSGSTVTQWNDKSGNGRNTSSAIGSSLRVSNAVNNLPGVYFNSTAFRGPFVYSGTQLHCFLVGTMGDSGQYSRVLSIGNGAQDDFDSPLTTIPFARGGPGVSALRVIRNNTGVSASFPAYNTPFLAVSAQYANTQEISVNGATPTTTTTNTSAAFSTTTYGLGIQNNITGSGEQTLVGYICELIVFNTYLTTTQRQTIEGYLSRKWGIGASTIPSTHPFSSIRPHLRPFQPTDVPGCLLWLDADDASNFTGSTWNDKSGTNNHAVNGTPGTSSMPTVTTWSNGRRAARFVKESKNSMKTTNSIPLYVTYFIVARVQDVIGATGFALLMVNNYDGQRQLRTNSTSFPVSVFYFTQTGGTNMVLGSFSQGQGFLFSGTVTSDSAIGYSNGVQIGTSGVNPNTIPSRHYFGSGDGDAAYVSADFGEILIYDSILTTSERQQVEGYLAHKWGLTPSLPVISPLSIPGCALWLDGADQSSMTLSGSSITQLRDKSGNGNHMVSNGTSPLYNSSLINSVGGIDCTNGGALISSGIQNSANISFAMVAVVKSGIRNWGSFFTHGDRDYDFAVERQENTSSINFQTANDNSSCTITFTVDAPVLYFGTMTSGTTRFFESFSGGVNTIVNGTNPSTISLGSKIIRVGKSDNNNELCNSFIGEIIYYTTVLTTTQRQQIEGYLARKWGISIGTTLPSPHPFRSIPPASLPFSPRNISGLVLWLDAADSSTITLNGSTVSSWADKSGNGNTVTQATSANQPTYVTNVVNGNPVLRFNGTSHVLQKTSFTSLGTNSVSFWLVERNLSNSGGGAPFSFNSGPNNGIVFQNNNGLQPLPNSVPYTSSVARIVFYNRTNTGSGDSTYLNGTVVTTRDDNTTGTYGTTFAVGMRILSSIYTSGDICEILIFIGMPTTSQRQQVEGYLAHKWGVTAFYTNTLPLTIPGCQLWLDAADSSTVTGTTTVTQWRDKSGNARHLGVGSGTTSYSSNAIVLNSSYMFVNSPIDLSKVTVFIVTKSTGVNNQTVFTAKPNSGWSWNSLDGFGFYIDAAVPKIRFYGDFTGVSEFNVNSSSTRLFSFQSSGTSINSWLEGTSQSGGTLTSTRTSTAQGFAIGGEWNRDQNTYINLVATASIYEIIVYNSDVTATQRQTIEGYLARKWGFTSMYPALPSTHPYSKLPPA